MPNVSFTLNGRPTNVPFEEGMHFLEVLREECGMTSPKDGCAPQGHCGCCTILVDGRPVMACLRRPEQMAGKEVTTLEGLSEAKRRVLAEAFVREGAIQCGFCIPGIVARASALLDDGRARDADAVRKALSGHLCRCTGYSRIVDAIQTAGEAWSDSGHVAAGAPRRPHLFGEQFGLSRTSEPGRVDGIGRSSPRYRGADHSMGDKPYVADMRVDSMVHGAVVMSDHPRATVLEIDTARALAMPGVIAVLTATDVLGERYTGLIVSDWPLFVDVGETTRCVGDVIAVVVADTQFHARCAADAVGVRYDVLDPVTDPQAALEPDAPKVHEAGNLLEACAFQRGDVDGALATSEHVIERTFTTQRIEHAYLEPEAALAIPTESGLKVFTQGQGVHDDQRQIAAVLGVPLEEIEVELVTNGGAFGGKEDLSIQAHTALAAHVLGRPVRTVLTREQSIRMHPKRHPISVHLTVGADSAGRLTAVRARMVGDTGAYASVGMKVLERAAGHSCGPYRVPNVDVEAKTVYTNNPPCGAMRGFGANQAAFAIEGVMDLLAERVGVDGYDIRERNILGPGDRFATGQIMTESCGVRQTLEAVKDVYKNAQYAGIACGIKNTGIGNGQDDSGRVILKVLDDGDLEILTGYTDMGQGLFTILRQVVHEESGLDWATMRVRTVSYDDVVCGMTTASRATALGAAAAQIATRKLVADLATHSIDELAGREYQGEYVCDFTVPPGTDSDNPQTHLTFGYATQVVILDDDG
ncbi:MAG: molybdopterin-dependent oxidoreductase, partial [Gemmatimonadota bacterium]|nr:molybdopterin-dependent oxidoreductase [Gemmatimonadota bacterium]